MGKNDFCCATYCSNRRTKQPHLEFYRIPKEKRLRDKWLSLIRRKNFRPSESTRLCSEHFVGGKRSLEKDSISYLPTIFKRKRETAAPRNTRNSVNKVTVPVQLKVNATARRKSKRATSAKVSKLRAKPVLILIFSFILDSLRYFETFVTFFIAVLAVLLVSRKTNNGH